MYMAFAYDPYVCVTYVVYTAPMGARQNLEQKNTELITLIICSCARRQLKVPIRGIPNTGTFEFYTSTRKLGFG